MKTPETDNIQQFAASSETTRYSQFFTNTLANIVCRVFSLVLGLVLTPLFVHRLGADLYGIWVLNFTIFGYFYVLDSSFAGGVVKHVSEANAESGHALLARVINNSVLAYSLFGGMIFVFTYVFADPVLQFFNLAPENLATSKNLLMISGACAVLLWPLLVFPSVLKGLLKNVKLNMIQGVAALVGQTVLIICVYRGLSLGYLLMAFYAVSILSGLSIVYVVYREVNGFKLSPKLIDPTLLKQIMKFSFGLLVLEVISMLAFQADKLILAYFLPISAVTIYDIVTKAFYQLRSLYGMFLEVVQPMIFEANYKNDQAFIEKMVLKGTKYINMGYVPLIICGVVVSKPFITVWMGEEYGQYGYWSAFFISQYLFSPIVGVIGSVVVGMSKIRPLQIFSVCSVSLNLVISIIALKIIGLPGVLVGTVTSTYIVLFFAYPTYCRLVGISWRKPLIHNWKISFVLIFVFMFPGIWLGDSLIHSWLTLVVFSSVLMILIYAAMFLLFVEDEERNKIEALVRRFLVRV